jgi:hypothetical protein
MPTEAKTCRAITPPNSDACGKPATLKITFKDDDVAFVCQGCALFLQQTAESHGAMLKVEAL